MMVVVIKDGWSCRQQETHSLVQDLEPMPQSRGGSSLDGTGFFISSGAEVSFDCEGVDTLISFFTVGKIHGVKVGMEVGRGREFKGKVSRGKTEYRLEEDKVRED